MNNNFLTSPLLSFSSLLHDVDKDVTTIVVEVEDELHPGPAGDSGDDALSHVVMERGNEVRGWRCQSERAVTRRRRHQNHSPCVVCEL